MRCEPSQYMDESHWLRRNIRMSETHPSLQSHSSSLIGVSRDSKPPINSNEHSNQYNSLTPSYLYQPEKTSVWIKGVFFSLPGIIKQKTHVIISLPNRALSDPLRIFHVACGAEEIN